VNPNLFVYLLTYLLEAKLSDDEGTRVPSQDYQFESKFGLVIFGVPPVHPAVIGTYVAKRCGASRITPMCAMLLKLVCPDSYQPEIPVSYLLKRVARWCSG